MDAADPVIDTLNALRRVEANSLLPRLAEATVFVPPGSAAGHVDLQRMIEDDQQHLTWLDETVLDLKGNLAPLVGDIRSADLHYQEWKVLLPRLRDDQQRLAGAFEAAAQRVARCPQAADAVGRIAARHHAHVRQLERMLEEAGQIPT